MFADRTASATYDLTEEKCQIFMRQIARGLQVNRIFYNFVIQISIIMIIFDPVHPQSENHPSRPEGNHADRCLISLISYCRFTMSSLPTLRTTQTWGLLTLVFLKSCSRDRPVYQSPSWERWNSCLQRFNRIKAFKIIFLKLKFRCLTVPRPPRQQVYIVVLTNIPIDNCSI